jgi:hypothetical protein
VLVLEEFQEGELVSVTVPEELMLTDSITVREMLGLIEGLRLCVFVSVLVAVLEGVRLIVAVTLGVGVREGVGLTLFVGLVVILGVGVREAVGLTLFVGLVVILDDGLIEGLLEKLELTVEEVDIDAWAETDLEGVTDTERVREGVTDTVGGMANVPAKL